MSDTAVIDAIDEAINQCSHRDLVPTIEIQNFLLDIRLLVQTGATSVPTSPATLGTSRPDEETRDDDVGATWPTGIREDVQPERRDVE